MTSHEQQKTYANLWLKFSQLFVSHFTIANGTFDAKLLFFVTEEDVLSKTNRPYVFLSLSLSLSSLYIYITITKAYIYAPRCQLGNNGYSYIIVQ